MVIRKMQSYDFQSVDDFFNALPEDELTITLQLRKLVLTQYPTIKEKLNYSVPYYSFHKTICYIWPSSILWGSKKRRTGVEFGFTQGVHLHDPTHWLEKGKRKLIFYKTFHSFSERDEEILSEFLYEAVQIDNEQKEQRRKER